MNPDLQKAWSKTPDLAESFTIASNGACTLPSLCRVRYGINLRALKGLSLVLSFLSAVWYMQKDTVLVGCVLGFNVEQAQITRLHQQSTTRRSAEARCLAVKNKYALRINPF